MSKLSELSQEQQIKILLGLVVVCLIFGGLYFLVLPLKQRWQGEVEELETLTSQIERAKSLIERESDAHEVLMARRETMRMISSRMIPPRENTFVWATELAYDYGRRLGLKIDSINEVSQRVMSWDRRGSDSDRHFVPYQIRIDLRCSYAELRDFIALIQRDNPYASISELSIVNQPTAPETHRISINVLWPIPKQSARRSIDQIISLDFLENIGSD